MMKYIIYILSFFFILSCSNEKEISNDQAVQQQDSLVQNNSTAFNGVWVVTDYIKSIEKTRSPIKSADELGGVATMIIYEENLLDSFTVGASLNNHEGYSFTVYNVPGQNKNSLKTNLKDYTVESNFYELGYETIGDEVFLFLYHYTKANKLIDKKQFTKVAGMREGNDAAWGIEHIVNEKLFAGNYLLIDSTDAATEVSLAIDGSIAGSEDFTEYYVFTDFMGGPETELNSMCFNFLTVRQQCFAYEFVKDTLYLYSTTGGESEEDPVMLDKVQYRLVRKVK